MDFFNVALTVPPQRGQFHVAPALFQQRVFSSALVCMGVLGGSRIHQGSVCSDELSEAL